MRLDTRVDFYQEGQRVSDGMGGYKNGVPSVIESELAHVSPVKAERLLKEYGLVTTSAIYIILKHPFTLPLGFNFIMVNGKKYSVIESYTNKYTIILAQGI